MTTNRIIIMLLTLTALMQASIMHRQGGLSRPPASRPSVWDAQEGSVVDLAGMPVVGSPETDIALIALSDYECPFRQRHAAGVGKEILERYVEAGHVQYALANNPLAMHANAPFMATAAISAGDHGHYWG